MIESVAGTGGAGGPETMLPAPLLLPLFLAGGAAALIDEVTWFQLLALHAGGTSRAMAAVLATFMATAGASSASVNPGA